MSLTRLWMPTDNYYAGRSPCRLIVVHTTEGAQDIRSLGNFFANETDQASSHTGTDNNSSTVIGEYVHRANTAWTVADANSVSVNCEMCTPKGAADTWTRADWLAKDNILNATAAWVAEEAKYFGIPIIALTPAQAQNGGSGVCQHSDLGAWGGGHHDCGPGFPMDELIRRAKGGTTPTGGSSGMTSASAYDNSGRLHFAAVNQRDEVCYKGPNGNWYPISTDKANAALSGVTIVIGPPTEPPSPYANGCITITFTRDTDDSVCTWQKGVDDAGQWVITRIGGSYQ